MRRTYTEKERLDLISLVKAERATVREAAEQVGVTLSTAYKWMRDGALVSTDQHVLVSDAIFEVIHKGVAFTPRAARRRTH